jgi:hypothetical protein
VTRFFQAVWTGCLTAISFLVKYESLSSPFKENTMSLSKFIALCHERTIDPSLALENPAIIEALKAKDDETVVDILDTAY